MNTPDDLRYRKTHEWVRVEGDLCEMGITDYAQHAMGDIVYIKLPEVGDAVSAGDDLCDLESVKAVSGIYAPVTGEVVAVNESLEDTPEQINSDPYGAWICKIRFTELGELLSAEEYRKVCDAE